MTDVANELVSYGYEHGLIHGVITYDEEPIQMFDV